MDAIVPKSGKPMNVLVINPGGNSLKAEIISSQATQRFAFEGRSLLSLSIEGIGKDAKISRYEGKKMMHSESITAANFGNAAESLLVWCRNNGQDNTLRKLDCIGVRVVHGGAHFDAPALIDCGAEEKIVSFEKLAPLHNKGSNT